MTSATPILLMTRPLAAAHSFVARLPDKPAFQTIFSPLIDITFGPALPDMTDFCGLVFTSAHGVAAYQRAGGPILPAYVVGRATARAARLAGLPAQSADGNAEDLVRWLTDLGPGGPLLHIRGQHTTGRVADRLNAVGIPTREAVMYDQTEVALNGAALLALTGTTPIIAPVFSPRSAELLAKYSVKAPLLVAAMSEAVVKPLLGLHISELKIAARPESAAMERLVAELLDRASI